MEQIKSYLIDFVEGRVSVPEFEKHCETHPEVLDYLTQIADPKYKTSVTHRIKDESGKIIKYVPEILPFDAKISLYEELHNRSGSTVLGRHLNLHSYFSTVLTTAFPEEKIKKDQTLKNKFVFMLDACPSYIGGTEVNHLLEEVLEEIPEGLSRGERIKYYKTRIKTLFRIEGGNYPRWVQSPEWPISSSGKPMRFMEQMHGNGVLYKTMGYTLYVFMDDDTGERRIIEQFT